MASAVVIIFSLIFGFLLGAGIVWLRLKKRVKTALMHRANMDIALTAAFMFSTDKSYPKSFLN